MLEKVTVEKGTGTVLIKFGWFEEGEAKSVCSHEITTLHIEDSRARLLFGALRDFFEGSAVAKLGVEENE